MNAPKLPGKEEPAPEVKAEPLERADLDASTDRAAAESAEIMDQIGTKNVKNGLVSEKVENMKPNEGVMENVSQQGVSKLEDVEMRDIKNVSLPRESTSLELPIEVVKDESKTVAPVISSVAQWQSYAGEPKGFQVGVFLLPRISV